MALPDKLPAWVARAAADLDAGAADRGELLQAALEWVAFVRLCERLAAEGADPDAGPGVEHAMRLTMNGEMGLSEWRMLVELLAPDECGALAARVDPSAERAQVRAAALELVRCAGPSELCVVERVDLAADDAAVALRPLVGTSSQSPYTVLPSRIGRSVAAGELLLWDGAVAIPVPTWLAWYDRGHRALRLFAGREGASRQWLYRAREPGVPPERAATAPAGMPVILAEPTWATPVPARRAAAAPPDETFRSDETGLTGSAERVWREPFQPAPVEARVGEPHLVLRILDGREMMRFVELRRGAGVTLGRHPTAPLETGDPPPRLPLPDGALFAIHHGEVSRAHARVSVDPDDSVHLQDLGSTNGTLRNGVQLQPRARVALAPGDVVALGPVRLRLEIVDDVQLDRLFRLAALANDPRDRRDPLTHLLKPRFFEDELASVAEAGPDGSGVGVALLTVDRISQIHAQHGSAVADTAFHNVAMVVMHGVELPRLCTRAGYGEVLLAQPGADRAAMRELIAGLAAACVHQVRLVPVVRLAVTATADVRGDREPAEALIARLRAAPHPERFVAQRSGGP